MKIHAMKNIFWTLALLSICVSAQNWDFRDGGLHGFSHANFISAEMKESEGFVGVGESNAFLLTPQPIELQAADYKYLEVGLVSSEANLTVYFSRPDLSMSEKTRYDGIIDKGKNRVLIDLSKNPEWRGTVNAIRFDVVCAIGRRVNLRYIRLSSQEPKEANNGIIPNGDFSENGEFWSGNAKFASGNVVVPAGEAIVSDPFEMLSIGKYFWNVQADGKVSTSLEYYDIFGNSIGQETADTKACGEVRPPRNAASVRIRIANETQETVALKRVVFDALPNDIPAEEAAAVLLQGKKILDMPEFKKEFQGNWLWMAELDGKDDAFAVFEKTFEIKEIDEIRKAAFHITADNEWHASLNGHAIEGSNCKEWSVADSSSIKSYLKEGTNSLRVLVRNIDGLGGFIADLGLKKTDGQYELISSDSTWKCEALTNQEAWKDVSVENEPTVLGMNGIIPWGKIVHGEAMAIAARLEGMAVPAEFNESSKWAPKAALHFSGDGVVNENLDFSVRFQNDKYDFLVLDEMIPAGATDDSPIVNLDFAPATFEYFPEGTYNVRFKLNDIPLEAPQDMVVTIRRNTPASCLPTARIVDKDTVPQIQLDGAEKASMTQYLVDLGMNDHQYREMKQAFDQGIPAEWIHHVVTFDANGDPDFTNIDNMCTSVLARNPDVYFVLITALDCARNTTMTKFIEENPDAMVQNDKGERVFRHYNDVRQIAPSMASDKWLSEGDRILTLLIEHLKKMPYGQRVAGILPSSGLTWEWMYWGCQREGEFLDYSPAFRRAFVNFARDKYSTIENANRAWGRNFESFEEIVEKNLLPKPSERMDDGNPFSLRVPKDSQYVMDFNRCMAVVTSDAIIHFCETVKRASEGKLLTGAYYGYYNQILQSRWAQHSGHWALSRVLASEAVDIIHAPTSYNDRGPGGIGGFMIPDASAHLAGKVFVTESDIRTIYSGQPQFGMCNTLGETLAVFVREASMCLSHNVALRYYDFSKGWVFRDPRYCEMVGAIAKAEQEIMQAQPKIDDSANSIAVVISENSMEHQTYSSPLNVQGIANQYRQLVRTGVSFDCYLTPGLEKIPLEHRMWFFENPFKLSAEDYEYIKEKIIVPGNTVVFGMGVDVIQQDGYSTERMQALTGMSFRVEMEKQIEYPAALNEDGKRALGNPLMTKYDQLQKTLPLFLPLDDGTASILARDNSGTPLLAEKTINGCRVVYSALPCLMAAWLRSLAESAGLHCYNDIEEDVTWASGEILGIHCVTAGKRILRAPMANGTARELLTGKEYQIQDGAFVFDAPRMSSALFLLKAQ